MLNLSHRRERDPTAIFSWGVDSVMGQESKSHVAQAGWVSSSGIARVGHGTIGQVEESWLIVCNLSSPDLSHLLLLNGTLPSAATRVGGTHYLIGPRQFGI